MARGFLLDRNGGGKPFNRIDIGFPHLLQKLTGVGRQGFDVPALSLRVDGVEGERRFAGTAQASDDNQLVAGDLDVDVLEIVFARALDDDGVSHRRKIITLGLHMLSECNCTARLLPHTTFNKAAGKAAASEELKRTLSGRLRL